MLFNSTAFLVFLPVVFLLYWFVAGKPLKLQNLFLVAVGCVFYGWWDYRFLLLLAVSILVDFWVGIQIHNARDKRAKKRWLWSSIAVNLAILGFFKYYNFFANSWVEAWGTLGYKMDPWTLKIILPVGLSFYTFQSMSYVIEVYRGKVEPTRDFIAYAAYVSFFPQLVAGPIERPYNILPQMLRSREFSYRQGVEGLKLILWGMFKKVVIADSLAGTVGEIFSHHSQYAGATLTLGAIYFAVQIYCDFSGYSDIAIGTAKLFGIELMSNFKFPYFSRSIREFWRRWHISLSTWFRDYVYIPLGGSNGRRIRVIRNILVIFLISGFWHGANWTFIAWGGVHALLFLLALLGGSKGKPFSDIVAAGRWLPSLKETFQMAVTFACMVVAWVFFRSPSLPSAVDYLAHMRIGRPQFAFGLIYVALIMVLDWFNRKDERRPFNNRYDFLTITLLLLAVILFRYHDTSKIEFIYFQF